MSHHFFSKTTITNEEINALPLGAFQGKIFVIDNEKDLPSVFSEINDSSIVGFDTETKPVFVRGHRNYVALMQIALPSKVFLIRLNKTGVQSDIIGFLENTKVLKAGVALRDDIKALQRIKKFNPQGIVELADLAKKAGLQEEGVKKLTGLLLGFRVSKTAQTSNWEAQALNEKQILYAATDAWVCLEIYQKLKGASADSISFS